VWEGGKTTINALTGIVSGLYQLFSGQLGFASLGGPVKIAKLTGQVAGLGFIYLLQFTAFLSLNLAVLNILPFPALDGGRVLFLLIEKARRKRNNQKMEQIVNTAGFVFLLFLMAAVTIHDVIGK
jgi:regulator of sigma E protease